MDNVAKRGSGGAVGLSAIPAVLLGFYSELVERVSRLGADDRGLETLEYGLLILVGVVVLAVAINTLGGSISGFLSRLATTINNLG